MDQSRENDQNVINFQVAAEQRKKGEQKSEKII